MKRLTGLILCAALLWAALPPLSATAATEDDYRDELSVLNSEYKQLENEQKAIRAQLSQTQSRRASEEAKRDAVNGQVEATTRQIGLLSAQIDILSANIILREQEITAKEQVIGENVDLLKARLRAMYMTGSESVAGLVLGAEHFYDYLTRAEVTTRVAKHDRAMLDWLRAELAAIEDAKAEIEDNRALMDDYLSELSLKRVDLEVQSEQLTGAIQDIAALEAAYRQDSARLQAEMDAVQAELDQIYAQINSTGEYTGGVMGWPLPGFPTVTSDYGWRFGGTNYHTGIDISGRNAAGVGSLGQNIVAASGGTVVFVERNYTPNRGYGMYLIVDHGGGISTLYAHCSDILVSVGQSVARGEAVARVGNTGNSTGPHLHFEVREGRQWQNPWPYLRG